MHLAIFLINEHLEICPCFLRSQSNTSPHQFFFHANIRFICPKFSEIMAEKAKMAASIHQIQPTRFEY